MTSGQTRVVAVLDGAVIGSQSAPTSSEAGNGDMPLAPVVALHGWGRDRHDFDAISPIGAVTAFDLPGFGASPAPDEAWGAREYARLIAQAIASDDHLANTPDGVILLGHSFGGRVALCLAAERPDLIAGVIISGVPMLRDLRPGRGVPAVRWAKRLRRWHLISEKRLDAVRYRHGSDDYRAATGIMRQIFVTVVNEDYRNELAAIRCPVTMIWGVADTAAPMTQAIEAARMLGTGTELTELSGGHFALFEHHDVLIESITTMRQRLAAGARP